MGEKVYTHRFKTEEEFFNEFGPDWRDIIDYSWVTEMDPLFNKLLTTKQYNDILEDGIKIDGDVTTWSISYQMIIKITLEG